MAICERCEPWCATTRRQLKVRAQNLRYGGEPYPCEQCGGTEWATTEAFIGEEPSAEPSASLWWAGYAMIAVGAGMALAIAWAPW